MVVIREKSSQRKKFEKAARELETDDSEEAFNEALRKVGQAKSPKDEKPDD